jgi:UDP:flavonoid glycosyltransferase YjiC (YdhE family)
VRRPVVYLTLGTIFAEPGTFRAAIDAVAALDAEALVALGPVDPAALGEVPPSVHLERFVHQAAILASVDLVVHHGGSGTMLGAAAHGRPQLVLPLGADQFYNGDADVGRMDLVSRAA